MTEQEQPQQGHEPVAYDTDVPEDARPDYELDELDETGGDQS